MGLPLGTNSETRLLRKRSGFRISGGGIGGDPKGYRAMDRHGFSLT